VVIPIVPVVAEIIHQRSRHMDLPVPPVILRAGFQHANLVAAIFAQAIGQHAACGTGADDDVVEGRVEFHLSILTSYLAWHLRSPAPGVVPGVNWGHRGPALRATILRLSALKW